MIFLTFSNSIESEKAMNFLKNFTNYELRYFVDIQQKTNEQPLYLYDDNSTSPYKYHSYEENLNYGIPMKYSQDFAKSNSNSNFEEYYFTPQKVSNREFHSYPYDLNATQNSYQYSNEKSNMERVNFNINPNFHLNYVDNYLNGRPNSYYPLYMNQNIHENININTNLSPTNIQGSNKSFHNPNRKKHKMDQIEELEKNKIDLEMIAKKLDKRTTIMIKNIPYKMHKDDVLKLIEKNFSKKYDFFYIPMDIKV